MIEKNSTTARMIPTQINDCFYATLLVVAVTFYPSVGVGESSDYLAIF